VAWAITTSGSRANSDDVVILPDQLEGIRVPTSLPPARRDTVRRAAFPSIGGPWHRSPERIAEKPLASLVRCSEERRGRATDEGSLVISPHQATSSNPSATHCVSPPSRSMDTRPRSSTRSRCSPDASAQVSEPTEDPHERLLDEVLGRVAVSREQVGQAAGAGGVPRVQLTQPSSLPTFAGSLIRHDHHSRKAKTLESGTGLQVRIAGWSKARARASRRAGTMIPDARRRSFPSRASVANVSGLK
jgi:hypothetical protein